MSKKTFGMAAILCATAGMAFASGSDLSVTFETGAVPTGAEDCDAPDVCVPFGWTEVYIEQDCTYINGELQKNEAPHCEPDTYLVCFDKNNYVLDQDDNGAVDKGNGWGSGLQDASDCFVDNGDNTYSLRLGVTGRPDGLDGVFNGLFQNGPHGQIGEFTVCVTWIDGDRDGETDIYIDEFITGAEAFHINYTVPNGATSADINIDNTTGMVEVRCDVDFFKLTNLVPLCDYCIEQIGGLNCECTPTDARLGWYDKGCTQILTSGYGGDVPEYAKICAVADANGEINIGVTGEYDDNFNGIHDDWDVDGPHYHDDRAPVECPEPKHGHGEAGCYTLKVYVTGAHNPGSGSDNGGGGDSGEAAAMQLSLDRGDLNRDGQTNSSDLGILLGNFGWNGN